MDKRPSEAGIVVPPILPQIFWRATWSSDCGEGFASDFKELQQNGADRLTSGPPPVEHQPATGNALRVEVKEKDLVKDGWRAEAIPNFDDETPGNACLYGWSTLFPDEYPQNPHWDHGGKKERAFQVFAQWHHAGTTNPPPVAFIVSDPDDQLSLDLHDVGGHHRGTWPIAKMHRGHWHDFLIAIKWDTSDGQIAVWHNGNLVEFEPQTYRPQHGPEEMYPPAATNVLTNLSTLFEEPGFPTTAYMKIGLYRRPAPTTPAAPFVLYHDSVERYEPIFFDPLG